MRMTTYHCIYRDNWALMYWTIEIAHTYAYAIMLLIDNGKGKCRGALSI